MVAAGCVAVSLLSACGAGEASPPPSTSTAGSAASTGSSTTSSTTPPAGTKSTTAPPKAAPTAAVRDAVTSYSDAFLDADPVAAYELLSARCQDEVSLSYFTGIVTAAKMRYGKALPIRSFKAKVRDDVAVVSYGYDVPALDQENEPWVLESGKWKNDQC